MQNATLDEFRAWNEQLAALNEAGIPLDVSLGTSGQRLQRALERIQAVVARRVSRGETLDEALVGDDDDVPASYRSLVQMGIHSGNVSAAIDSSTRVGESLNKSRFTLEKSFIYPLVLCVLAYFGLIGFCLYLVPVWQEMFESARIAPGSGLRVLQALRNTLPYWFAIPPVLLLLAIVSWRRTKAAGATESINRSGLLAWLPGVKRIAFDEHCAQFAMSLKALLDGGMPLERALAIAADRTDDARLRRGAQLLAAETAQGELQRGQSQSRTSEMFPPFLRWALWDAHQTIGHQQALALAARMYRESANRRAERLRTLAPMFVIVAVGGTVTLLYGLALFVPFVELLQSIAF